MKYRSILQFPLMNGRPICSLLRSQIKVHPYRRVSLYLGAVRWPQQYIGPTGLKNAVFPAVQHLIMQQNWFSTRSDRKEEWGANKSPYEILQVPKNATQKEIKMAYFKQAKQHHPDMHPHDQDNAKKRFQVISSAYELLSDTSKRASYDSDVKASRWNNKTRGATGTNDWRDTSYANQHQYQHNPHSWQYRTSSQNDYYYSQRVWATVQQDMDVIKEMVQIYKEEIAEDIDYALEVLSRGEFKALVGVLSDNKLLLGTIVLPTIAILRFPFLIVPTLAVLLRLANTVGKMYSVLIVLLASFFESQAGRQAWRLLVARLRDRNYQKRRKGKALRDSFGRRV